MLVLLGSEHNVARLVPNMMASKACLKLTPKLHTRKRYACSLAVDGRWKVGKLMSKTPSGTFQDVSYSISLLETQLLTRVLNFSPIGTKQSRQRPIRSIFTERSENGLVFVVATLCEHAAASNLDSWLDAALLTSCAENYHDLCTKDGFNCKFERFLKLEGLKVSYG